MLIAGPVYQHLSYISCIDKQDRAFHGLGHAYLDTGPSRW
jgi:hypothetical protein